MPPLPEVMALALIVAPCWTRVASALGVVPCPEIAADLDASAADVARGVDAGAGQQAHAITRDGDVAAGLPRAVARGVEGARDQHRRRRS